MAAASNGSEFFEVQIDSARESFCQPSSAHDDEELLWEAILRLPSQKQGNFALLTKGPSPHGGGDESKTETVDVRRLDRVNRELVVKKALATNAQDNSSSFPQSESVLEGIEMPKVEVRFENLNVVTSVQTATRALPTLVNSVRDSIEGLLSAINVFRAKRFSLTILKNVSGVVQPGRMTLLLGPPGSGKSTLLLALAGKIDKSLKTTGEITYNGHKLKEFFVRRTSAYIGQTDTHIAEITVRETLDFAARWQGANEALQVRFMKDLVNLEKERKIRPSLEIDAFMKASVVGSRRHSISTDYVLRVLGLDVCSETVVGNDMLRGVSGGQRKRVTTGEMIVGPRKTLFMDEISTGLDSSTTYQIVKCIGNFVHEMSGTVLMALLQPSPETFDLFDDLLLLSEGYVVYQGPRAEVLEFFESLGFRLPTRKAIADFLQEDQAQYWADSSKPYSYIPVSEIATSFQNSRFGSAVASKLAVPYDKSRSHPLALSRTKYAVSSWELFKTCFAREWMLIRRHSFLYIFRTCQVAFIGLVACTIFLRTRIHATDEEDGKLYLSCLFYGLVHMMFNGFSELSLLIHRLPVFYKQRDNLFHPAWAWSIASFILRIPYSVIESVVWSCVVYYSVGFAPGAGRFFRYMLLLLAIHQMALGLFRMMASISRDLVVANTFGSAALMIVFCLGGFIIPKVTVYHVHFAFHQTSKLIKTLFQLSSISNITVGRNVLHQFNLPHDDYWYWLGLGVLLAYAILFNIIVTMALACLNPRRRAQTVADDALEEDHECGRKGMLLPFQPLTMTFHNVNYSVDMPRAMSKQGIPKKKLQLLSSVSGAFSPGVLTALVGSSGAGKTTLMDVLAGRKTGGYIEGEIKISGYPKEQRIFARISGYVEQNDIHSPRVLVEESLWFSPILDRRSYQTTKTLMKLVELDTLRLALVGLPGTTGLSTKQRKRLTIAVELVANPSIIFMDEPTSGLDARAAAIVMRTVRNTVDTGRTVVCTIHQPSIDIFEAFDELLLMKRGGKVIYGGKLGVNSQIMIDYFQGINGIPRIPDGYNPATWMLEVTTPLIEEQIGEDLADIYEKSEVFREVETSIMRFSTPATGSQPLKFDSTFAQNSFTQLTICIWKQNLVYWRSPRYNTVRILFTTAAALILGSIFWDDGSKRSSTQAVYTVMGALYASCIFLGISNASSVQPIVSIERTVFYREKAAGMYSPLSYAMAQGLVEVPYILVQTILYGVITYFMVNFERNAGKFLLYLVFMFFTFTYFTFYGMMAVGVTPNQHMAAVISSAFYSLWNLLSGFLIPQPRIPGWWIWFYYISPIAWTLKGIISSQLGDVDTKIESPAFDGSVKEYLKKNFDYQTEDVGISAVVLIAFASCFSLLRPLYASAQFPKTIDIYRSPRK
ncbi:hypothetical protein K2173_013115 [Erythroxylum novogranatense]|uniref:ABC transporter domain-containing protein n=1 Tax=Erythroxylum novogranatense TaxID=1862640 RepID=A0AAV8S6R2_9ROSI|nr:hypothetical protein K2173_013115 [Erythroxylum novogranatense]